MCRFILGSSQRRAKILCQPWETQQGVQKENDINQCCVVCTCTKYVKHDIACDEGKGLGSNDSADEKKKTKMKQGIISTNDASN